MYYSHYRKYEDKGRNLDLMKLYSSVKSFKGFEIFQVKSNTLRL